MKRSTTFCLFLSLFIFAASALNAKTTTSKEGASNATDNTGSTGTMQTITSADIANVFADDDAAKTTIAYNVYATNIFADDVFTDDVKSNDVLIASVITSELTTGNDNAAVPTLDLNTIPGNGMLNIKTETAAKLYYYTEPHTDKNGNIVEGGKNTLYVQKVLSPGVFACRFEGADGHVATVKVVCKQ